MAADAAVTTGPADAARAGLADRTEVTAGATGTTVATKTTITAGTAVTSGIARPTTVPDQGNDSGCRVAVNAVDASSTLGASTTNPARTTHTAGATGTAKPDQQTGLTT